MTLSDCCAWFFVARRLGIFQPGVPPRDGPLDRSIDREALARELAAAVQDAGLVTAGRPVAVDCPLLMKTSVTWTRFFGVCADLLASSFVAPPGSQSACNTRDAYADYLAARWVFEEVLGVEIRRRPLDREFPPSYDPTAKRGLAETLVSLVHGIGLAVRDERAFVAAATGWNQMDQAVDALIAQVGA